MFVKKVLLMWGFYCMFFQLDRELYGLSEGMGNNILLLFFGQGVKMYGVVRYVDGQLWIFFWVFYCVEQYFVVYDVYVQVLIIFDGCFVMEVIIYQICQVGFMNFVVFIQCVWYDREGIRDIIFCVSKWQFSDGGQRGYCIFLVMVVYWVSIWIEWCVSVMIVWGIIGFFIVYYVRGDGQNRLSWDSVVVGVQFLNFFYEMFNQVNGYVIDVRVVVIKLWVFVFDFEVDSQIVFVMNWFNFCIFDSRQGVSSNGQISDIICYGVDNVMVVQCYQRGFVVVFVVYVVDDVQCGDVLFSQLVYEVIYVIYYFVEVQDVVFDWFRFWINLYFQFFIYVVVDSVQYGFCEVSVSVEELYLFINNYWVYVVCDSVVVVVEVWMYQVIVFILQRRGIDGYFSGEFFEVQWQFFRLQDSNVWFWRWFYGIQGVQEVEVVFGYQSMVVNVYIVDGFCCLNWVVGEQFIIFWGMQEVNYMQFYDQVVNYFLCVLFGDFICLQVMFDVDIQEVGGMIEGYCCVVLRFYGSQVIEVGLLNCFLSGGCWIGDVIVIFSCYFFDLVQCVVLFSDFFMQMDGCFQVFVVFQFCLQRVELGEFVFYQEVDIVQCNVMVVIDDMIMIVSIWQICQYVGFMVVQDVWGIDVENVLVVSFMVFCEDFFQYWVQFVIICFVGIFNYFDIIEWDDCMFQWCFGLQINDFFQIFFDIVCVVRGDGGSQGSVKINRCVSVVFLFYIFYYGVLQFGGCFSCVSQEGFVVFIWGVVFLNKVMDVDFILLVIFCKIFSGCG